MEMSIAAVSDLGFWMDCLLWVE